MLPSCTPIQNVYAISAFGETYTGDSPSGLCSYVTGSNFAHADLHMCYSQSYGAFAIRQVCQPPNEISFAPFNLTLAEGGLLAAAIVSVWAVGFAIRQLVRVMRDSDGGTDASDS